MTVTRPVQRVDDGAIDVRAPKYGSKRVVYLLADSLVDSSRGRRHIRRRRP
jgi:hypothetical protein